MGQEGRYCDWLSLCFLPCKVETISVSQVAAWWHLLTVLGCALREMNNEWRETRCGL